MCFQIQPRLWVNTSSSLVFYCFAIFCNCAENFAVKNLFNNLICFHDSCVLLEASQRRLLDLEGGFHIGLKKHCAMG